MILVLSVAVLSTPATAQPSLVDICTEGARLYYGAESAVAVEPESFPELDPPRVRMDVRLSTEIELSGIAGLLAKERGEPTTTSSEDTYAGVLCRFDSNGRLDEFCGADGCFATNQERVEEVKVLLEREGY